MDLVKLGVCTSASGSRDGKGVSSLVLAYGVDVANGKVLHDFRHVLVLEERVPAGFVWGGEKSGTSHRLQTNPERGKEEKKNPNSLRLSPMSCMVRMMGLSALGTPFMVQRILP